MMGNELSQLDTDFVHPLLVETQIILDIKNSNCDAESLTGTLLKII